jgi:hypothetical protein
VQIEHALAVVAQGTTSLGIKGMYFYLRSRFMFQLERLNVQLQMAL